MYSWWLPPCSLWEGAAGGRGSACFPAGYPGAHGCQLSCGCPGKAIEVQRYLLPPGGVSTQPLMPGPAPICPFQGSGTQASLQHRQFRIQQKGDTFVLEGWDRAFLSVRQLLDTLKGCTLKSGNENFTVCRCCPPKPGGRSQEAMGWALGMWPDLCAWASH